MVSAFCVFDRVCPTNTKKIWPFTNGKAYLVCQNEENPLIIFHPSNFLRGIILNSKVRFLSNDVLQHLKTIANKWQSRYVLVEIFNKPYFVCQKAMSVKINCCFNLYLRLNLVCWHAKKQVNIWATTILNAKLLRLSN